MNKLYAGLTLVAIGIIALIVHAKTDKKEDKSFQTPYLKNGGIGFILFGVYNLLTYLLK